MKDPCVHCEEMMQPYLDHVLTDAEMAEAEAHLDECESCRRRYRFEERLRQYVRIAVQEPMPTELKAKLAALRDVAGREGGGPEAERQLALGPEGAVREIAALTVG